MADSVKTYSYFLPVLILLFISTARFYGQTAGINYQALILNDQEIEMPGENIQQRNVPLALEEVVFRFTITGENTSNILFSEEQLAVTDENGLVSLIIGEGVASFSSFENINWDGTTKYLNVDIDILSNTEGFTLLDSQKILYLPQGVIGGANLQIVTALPHGSENTVGDMVLLTNADGSATLYVWDGTQWISPKQTSDIRPSLTLTTDDADRDALLPNPNTGQQVWNLACSCIQVFNGTDWLSIATTYSNGLTVSGNTLELGGALTKPTLIETTDSNTLAITGLESGSIADPDNDLLALDRNTGVLTRVDIASLTQERTKINIIAVDGQNRFTVPRDIDNSNKISVFRNGVNLNFTVVDSRTIELETGVFCYDNDEIKIIQFF